jgi:hypothetical protein
MDKRLRGKSYQPPRGGDKFKKYWDRLLPKVAFRKNFHEAHLFNLEILCTLYVEYEIISDLFELEGPQAMITTTEGGRNGPQEKVSVLATRRDKVLVEIRNYSKLLGLLLAKDEEVKDEEDKNEWDD